ncbi:c-type cytochrome domain-containing protein [Rubellicoccus peritrichatus]|uniref:C-type cytochrome domain-containing protein n=1 Tax=Rubellicoccus peritrichatus TaxID=3080537 RepID=A0AAQ3L7H9_9BACT|nr:c-type cytochrome domain-containing protein [Puniceicoccus sp. CR14]WOO39264.1 c-type cytochrome domain-containing protein [Puniceicoccus sp. CR14]
MPDFLLPFGPLHILFLHLPIGVLFAILFVEIFFRSDDKKRVVGLLYLLLILTTAITIVLGLAYEDYGQFGDEVENHELWGFIFGGSLLVTYMLYWVDRKLHKFETLYIYIASLIFTTVAMFITGHYGGEMTHGKGFITKPFEEKTPRIVTTNTEEPSKDKSTEISRPKQQTKATQKKATNTAPSADPHAGMMDVEVMEAVAANDPPVDRIALFNAAHMVLERNCFECHGATKQKGSYRLDEKGTIYDGGKSRQIAIVPGDPDHSELLYRMSLPVDDDDVMPPENKMRVSPQDITKVRQWIASGAYWPTQEEIDAAPTSYVEIGSAATNALIEKINETGAKAEYNAWGDNSVRVDLGVVNIAELDQALMALKPLGNNLKWLDCSHLKLPESFFQELQQFPKLQRLHLDGTNVSDANLQQLIRLPELTYLNLYNTNISDQGIKAIAQYPSLEQVFLTDTKVTPEGIESLKSNNSYLEVIHRQ